MQYNFIILSISQANWWAIIAWLIRVGAWLRTKNKFSETFAHSALAYYGHDRKLYIFDLNGSGSRIRPYEQIYGKSFKGHIKASLTPFRVNCKRLQKLIEINSAKTYSVPAAIKSQFGDFPYIEGDNESFCSWAVIDNIENISSEDVFAGKNNKNSPTELYNYITNILDYPTINIRG